MLIYFIIALVGTIFLLASAVLGEIFDFFGDMDVADGDVHPLSGKVIATALIAFGAAGMITQYYGWGAGLSALTAALSAGFLGALAWWFLGAVERQTGSTDVSISSMLGRSGIVIVPVSAGSVGEIQISMVSGTRRMIARSASNELIPAGTAVRIVELTGSVALIERLDQQAVAAAKPQRVEG